MMFWIDRPMRVRGVPPHSFLSGMLLLLLIGGCHPSTLYYEPEPSPRALVGISGIYLDEVTGQNAELIRHLLIQELHKVPTFDVLETFPESPKEGVVLSAEILVYSKRDKENTEEQQKTFLVSQDRWQPGKSTGQRLKNQVYDFVATPYRLRTLNRTLDLSLKIKVVTPDQRILYQNTESIHFLQTYQGEEALVFMPQAEDQMEGLGRLLIQRLFEKLNPSTSKKRIPLETGVPVQAWGGFLSILHPALVRGNELAVRGDYEGAIDLWSVVIFAPAGLESRGTYSFNDAFYETLKKKTLPSDLIQSLLPLHGRIFSEDSIELELKQKISLLHYQKYLKIILQSSRMHRELEQKTWRQPIIIWEPFIVLKISYLWPPTILLRPMPKCLQKNMHRHGPTSNKNSVLLMP